MVLTEKEAERVFQTWLRRPNAVQEFNIKLAESDALYEPILRQLEDSERLTAKDYYLVINT